MNKDTLNKLTALGEKWMSQEGRDELDEIIAAERTTSPVSQITDATIREIFMAHGFTIKDGQTDLKPYVYAAARALLTAAPAAPVAKQAELPPLPPYVKYALHCLAGEEAKAEAERQMRDYARAAIAASQQAAEPVARMVKYIQQRGRKGTITAYMPFDTELTNVARIIEDVPLYAAQAAQQPQGKPNADCSGDPKSCPDNEGYGCACDPMNKAGSGG